MYMAAVTPLWCKAICDHAPFLRHSHIATNYVIANNLPQVSLRDCVVYPHMCINSISTLYEGLDVSPVLQCIVMIIHACQITYLTAEWLLQVLISSE